MPKGGAASSYCSKDCQRDYDSEMRVLLVEDDSRIAHFVAKGLREQTYAVDVVGSGEEALYQAAINTYDVMILDVMIPAPDGFAVCKELRKSWAADADLDADGSRRGGRPYRGIGSWSRRLPHETVRVSRTVGSFPSAAAEAEQVYSRRNWWWRISVVDTAGQTVSRGGKTISMTAKEYALVEFLARNAGRVVGRAEIAEHVWDEEFDPFSNLIEVYVNRVRRKIDWVGAKPLLHTRRGAGYVLSLNETPAEPKTTALRKRNDA